MTTIEILICIYSDGVGRTGTYILLDIVLNRICKGAREINIAATLEHIRDQRAKMVKTKVRKTFSSSFEIINDFPLLLLGSIRICLRCCSRRSNLFIKSITTIK